MKLVIVLGLLLFAIPARADTLVDFNNVYASSNVQPQINLAAHPGAVLEVGSFDPTPFLPIDTSRFLSYLSFAFLPSYVSNGLPDSQQPSITWTLLYGSTSITRQFPIYYESTDTTGNGFYFTDTFYSSDTPASLLVSEFAPSGDVMGSAAYNFSLTQPVPEPSMFTLLACGILSTAFLLKCKWAPHFPTLDGHQEHQETLTLSLRRESESVAGAHDK